MRVAGRTDTTKLEDAFPSFSTASVQHRSRSAAPPALPSALCVSGAHLTRHLQFWWSPILFIAISPLKLTQFPETVQSNFVSLTTSALSIPLDPHNGHASRPRPPQILIITKSQFKASYTTASEPSGNCWQRHVARHGPRSLCFV